jgi:hypothetical protein
MDRPIASISLDLDNKWSYLKTHGDSAWRLFPSYFDLVVPRLLEFFERRKIAITAFVVGQDAALPENRRALAAIADAGHEIANHSFHHDPWLHEYSREQLHAELAASEAAIVQATGQRPIGFRGPGFSISDGVIEVLAERGYLYDATLFPTFLGPVARAYYFLRSNLNRSQRAQRKALFGRWRDGFRPLRPFEWKLAERRLVEVPVTTMPLLKLPIHLSYLIYLSKFAPWLARQYFRQSVYLCRQLRVQPSLLVHPLDFLGVEDESDLSFFPGMDLPRSRKLNVVAETIDALARRFRPVTVREHAEWALGRNLARRDLALVRPAL